MTEYVQLYQKALTIALVHKDILAKGARFATYVRWMAGTLIVEMGCAVTTMDKEYTSVLVMKENTSSTLSGNVLVCALEQ